jgi:hypothetical protein
MNFLIAHQGTDLHTMQDYLGLPWHRDRYRLAVSLRHGSSKDYFDGAKTYKVTLPKAIAEANSWSLTLYDNQTRSMLDTPQRYPRVGDQSYPSPVAESNADGSTTVYLSPTQPEGGNWIQTMPGKGWFAIVRRSSRSSQRSRGPARSRKCAKAPADARCVDCRLQGSFQWLSMGHIRALADFRIGSWTCQNAGREEHVERPSFPGPMSWQAMSRRLGNRGADGT